MQASAARIRKFLMRPQKLFCKYLLGDQITKILGLECFVPNDIRMYMHVNIRMYAKQKHSRCKKRGQVESISLAFKVRISVMPFLF